MVDKNLLLVKSISKYPCIYNHTLSDYLKRDTTDKAWNEVAKETNLTVTECKEKWKNLRYGFIRSLRPNPDGSSKKRYYLHDEMEFVLPFVKLLSKQSGSYVYVPSGEGDSDEEYADSQTEITQSPHYPTFVEIDTQNAIERSKKKRMKKSHDMEKIEESRKMFLLSLLPEVNQLTENQMKIFRRKVLTLLDEIADMTAPSVSSIFQWPEDESDIKENALVKSEP